MDANPGRRVTVRLNFLTGPRALDVAEHTLVGTTTPPQPMTGLLIGRNKQSAIVIDAKDISRQHAELLADAAGNIYVRDNGSINGTLINGMQTASGQTVRLRPGDHITLGLSEFSLEWLIETPVSESRLPLTDRPTLVTPPTTAPVSDDQAIPYLFVHNGQRYLIEGDEAYIGRGPTNDIVIDQPSLSRQHARIQRAQDGLMVLTDLGSTNGTFVNGQRISTPTPLRGETVIRFGDVLADFRFERQRMSAFMELADRTLVGLPEESEPAITLRSIEPMPSANNTALSTFASQQTYISTVVQEVAAPPLQQSDASVIVPVPVEVVGRVTRLPEATTSSTVPGLVQVEEVSKSYSYRRGRAVVVALNNVSLSLRRGDVTGLIGPTASGKSTLLRILAGLEKADRGQVMVAGRNMSGESANMGNMARLGFGQRPTMPGAADVNQWRATNLGFLTQSDGLVLTPAVGQMRLLDWMLEPMVAGQWPHGDSSTLQENREQRAIELLSRFGIGLEKLSEERLEMLTPMERRLAALARSLAADPPLLLLDDPTLGLTSRMSHTALTFISQTAEREGRTVLLASSDASLTRLLSRHIEILDGEVVGSAS